MVSGQQVEQEKKKDNSFFRNRLKWSVIIFGLVIMLMGIIPIFFTTVMLISSSGYATYTSWVLGKRGFKWALIPLFISTIIFFILIFAFIFGLVLGFTDI